MIYEIKNGVYVRFTFKRDDSQTSVECDSTQRLEISLSRLDIAGLRAALGQELQNQALLLFEKDREAEHGIS